MRNIRLTLAYDGTNYVGWQVQPNGSSVQATIETAIRQLTGKSVRLTAAGRTDAGVHALGQVANFSTDSTIPVENIRSGLQNFLPADIVVRDVVLADPEFHATYGAVQKRYRYVIYNSSVRSPFFSRYTWSYSAALDTAAMQQAADELIGRHDFRSFESHFPNKATSVRTVTGAIVGRLPGWSVWSRVSAFPQEDDRSGSSAPQDEFVCFEITADGFLYNMVRAIVGTLLKVGRGQWTADDVRRIIAGQDRSLAGETAPARGLYLVQVEYPDDPCEGNTGRLTPPARQS